MTISLVKLSQGRVYLDHNATTPPLASIFENVGEWTSVWGNPSSIHWAGRGPKTILRETREKLAQVLGCHPLELIFTSGGSEANNLVLRGTVDHYLRQGRAFHQIHILSSTIEHPSVAKTLSDLETLGVRVTRISVNRKGEFDWGGFEGALTPETVLVSMMAANNETGTLLPIQEIVKFCHDKKVRVHTDAVQTLGKLTIKLNQSGVDYASFSAHKFHALKGLGWLYCKKNSPLVSQITGGGQERGRRGGTENTLAIRALQEVIPWLSKVDQYYPRLTELRDFFEQTLQQKITGVTVTAGETRRLPNTSSLVIEGVDGETLLMRLDLAGFAVSTGAACSSGSPEPSPVLLAMGLSRSEAQSSLRVSMGWETQKEDLERFIGTLKEIVDHLRSLKERS